MIDYRAVSQIQSHLTTNFFVCCRSCDFWAWMEIQQCLAVNPGCPAPQAWPLAPSHCPPFLLPGTPVTLLTFPDMCCCAQLRFVTSLKYFADRIWGGRAAVFSSLACLKTRILQPAFNWEFLASFRLVQTAQILNFSVLTGYHVMFWVLLRM